MVCQKILLWPCTNNNKNNSRTQDYQASPTWDFELDFLWSKVQTCSLNLNLMILLASSTMCFGPRQMIPFPFCLLGRKWTKKIITLFTIANHTIYFLVHMSYLHFFALQFGYYWPSQSISVLVNSHQTTTTHNFWIGLLVPATVPDIFGFVFCHNLISLHLQYTQSHLYFVTFAYIFVDFAFCYICMHFVAVTFIRHCILCHFLLVAAKENRS